MNAFPPRRLALPMRFLQADPILLARSRVHPARAALFQRFDLLTRRLARSIVPLVLRPIGLIDLEADLRRHLPGSDAEAPILLFAGVEALCGEASAQTPSWLAYRLDRYIEIDHSRNEGWLVDFDGAPEAVLFDELDTRLNNQALASGTPTAAAAPAAQWHHDTDEALHARRVLQTQQALGARNLHGALLSIGMQRETRADPFDVYAACVASNPSPYGYVLSEGDFAVVGSSPLAFLQLQHGKAHLETDAGTRPVTREAVVDDAAEADLRRNPKDAAEHQVVVNAELEALASLTTASGLRTVVSREVRRFSHVMHLYSAFEADLPAELDVVDAIRAVAPAAAVSGHPKREALALGREVEQCERGPYGGILGLITSPRDADLAVVIRSMWLHGGNAHLRVGGKIVPDSDPAAEYREALSKSTFLVDALARAEHRQVRP